MLKNTLFVVASTIAVVTSFSLPAAAVECEPGEEPNEFGICQPVPRRVPEPSTILGSLVVVGALIGKKGLDNKKVSK